MYQTIRAFLFLGFAVLIAACDPTADLEDPPVDLGNFKLGHNIAVVVKDVSVFPASRTATDEEWVEALKAAIEQRFGRYDGDKLYHISLSLRGYNLSPVQVPGVPAPPSAINLHARIWDDAKGAMLNDKPKDLQIVDVVKASGIGANKEQQISFLAATAAKEVEQWLLENPEWFAISD